MSARYYQFCPIAKASEILGERWTILIVRELLLGATRFAELQRGLSAISPTLLTRRLGQLQDCGLVVRRAVPGTGRAEYSLTPAGRELHPVVVGLGRWGMKWARGQMSDDELDVQHLMADLARRIDETQLPGGDTVIQFSFQRLPKFAHWWVLLAADGTRELCANNPGRNAHLQLRTDLRTMVEIWAGDIRIADAVKSGRVQVSGEPLLARTLAAWLRPGALSDVRPCSGVSPRSRPRAQRSSASARPGRKQRRRRS